MYACGRLGISCRPELSYSTDKKNRHSAEIMLEAAAAVKGRAQDFHGRGQAASPMKGQAIGNAAGASACVMATD